MLTLTLILTLTLTLTLTRTLTLTLVIEEGYAGRGPQSRPMLAEAPNPDQCRPRPPILTKIVPSETATLPPPPDLGGGVQCPPQMAPPLSARMPLPSQLVCVPSLFARLCRLRSARACAQL